MTKMNKPDPIFDLQTTCRQFSKKMCDVFLSHIKSGEFSIEAKTFQRLAMRSKFKHASCFGTASQNRTQLEKGILSILNFT